MGSLGYLSTLNPMCRLCVMVCAHGGMIGGFVASGEEVDIHGDNVDGSGVARGLGSSMLINQCRLCRLDGMHSSIHHESLLGYRRRLLLSF